MRRSLFSVLVLFMAVAAIASAYGEMDLDRARDLMNRGDYRRAIDQFRYVARNSSFDYEVRREASYYIGFCCVKISDPWGAIEAYQNFVDRWDNGNSRFVPDALYVLGRTYEEVQKIDEARRCYRRCIERFPHSEFARKSEDRLRIVGGGGGGHGGGHHPPPPPPPPHGGGGHHGGGITPEVYDMIRLAQLDPNSYSADQMLLKAARRCRMGPDFVAVSKATRNAYTQSQIIGIAMESSAFRTMSPYDVVDLAKTTTSSYERGRLLLDYARRVADRFEDFELLANAAPEAYTKSQILQIAREKLGNGHGHGGPHYDIQMSVQNADVGPQEVKKSASDPFVGFKFDSEKVRRVQWFIDSVSTKKNIDETSKLLKKEDMSLDVVRSALKNAETQQKFDELHQGK